MINNSKVLGLLGLCAKSGNIVCGTDACLEDMKKNRVKLLIVAEDASDRTKRNFEFMCKNLNIPICILGDIENLSKAIGKKNKAVIGIKGESFAKEILKITNGGDVIG